MNARRVLLFLVLGGLLARVLYLGQVSALPFFQDPVGDSARYLERAREILQGRFVADRPFFYGGIFYPWILAGSFRLLGADLYPIALLQAVAGCATAWALFELPVAAVPPGRKREGEWIGLLTAAMALLYGPFAFIEADVLMISWTLLLLAGAALLLARSVSAGAAGGRVPGIQGRRIGTVAAAGICLGLAASERPNLVALLPLLAVWLAAFSPPGSRLRRAGALLGGGALVVCAIALMNFAASGRWVLLTTSGGINFYIGNHPGATGTYDEPWSGADTHFTARETDLERASLALARERSGLDLDPVDASGYWLREGLRFVREHPAHTARLWIRRLLLFWNAREAPNHLDFNFMRAIAPALWLMPLTFGLVAPLGLYGMLEPAARRLISRPVAWLAAILVTVPMLTVLPFFVADRYRLPAVPFLMLFAACALVDLWRRALHPLTRRSGSIRIACVVLLGAGLAAPMTGFDDSRNHWMLAQAYGRAGDLDAAVLAYERAVAASPRDAVLLNNLGVALARTGDTAGAESRYRAAVAADPTLAFPRKNLGLLLMRPGGLEEAFEHLKVAERREPSDLEIARALAVLHLARGERQEAGSRARAVLDSLPADPTARQVLEALDRPRP